MDIINDISDLIKKRDFLMRRLSLIRETKEWTQITVKGEDGRENTRAFSFGGSGENIKEDNELAKDIHAMIMQNFTERLKDVDFEIRQLLR